VQAGDAIELEVADPAGLLMTDLIAALFLPSPAPGLLARALALPSLPPRHRARLLARQDGRDQA
jgi:hypothetical protein